MSELINELLELKEEQVLTEVFAPMLNEEDVKMSAPRDAADVIAEIMGA